VMFLVFVGSKLTVNAYDQLKTWIIGGGAGTIIAWLGKSRYSPAARSAKSASGISMNVILAIAAPIFIAALIVGLSGLIDRILFHASLIDTAEFGRPVTTSDYPPWPGSGREFIAVAIAIVVGCLASIWVNINRFSLHALYRNRLIRAFLGASNPERRPNPFTDFDENDNIRVYDLRFPETAPGRWPTLNPQRWRPFHVINMALNVVSTTKLAWHERKAESFTVSPLHSGSAYLGYRYSTGYGDKQGISLGTAVAISGAAASSNMGYHSSPALAFLLTMFNVRLGWWLGNPGPAGEKVFQRDAPFFSVKPLLAEMFGLTTDQHKYIYLSDGGHFENLGLYEMVRRRCRSIIVVDAGCDKEYAFEDLGNAARKIELDLGIKITFRGITELKFRGERDATYAQWHPPYHAIGSIDYQTADGGGQNGIIIYLKPAFHGNQIRNVGVRNYAFANADFPHQSTGDQFFSESQLESYRAFGFEMMDDILTQAVSDASCVPNPSLEQIIEVIAAKSAIGP
jgi:hypothetical protein